MADARVCENEASGFHYYKVVEIVAAAELRILSDAEVCKNEAAGFHCD